MSFNNSTRTILITGGAGFIGSHLVRRFVTEYPQYNIVNLDALTYAGNLENLKDIEQYSNYYFVHGNICNESFVQELFERYHFDAVIHTAAESHVDRSISNPMEFVNTNIVGTTILLNAVRHHWKLPSDQHIFFYMNTDEVYGSLGEKDYPSIETSPYKPRSPYAASKASAEYLIRAYYETYGLPIKISNCTNNYGPYQFPEKLIPLVINNVRKYEHIPVYGDGTNIRDWLYVEDHVRAIDLIFHKGKIGETYNIGSGVEQKNIDLIRRICAIMDPKFDRIIGESQDLIQFVKDREGHDKRYAIDSTKLRTELGWAPTVSLKEGLEKTIDWYLVNHVWLEHIVSGKYTEYYEQQYAHR